MPIKLSEEFVPAFPAVLQLFKGVAKVDTGSFFTSPLVIVKRLSVAVAVPVCTPVSVKGLIPFTCNFVDGFAIPIPTLPVPSIRIRSFAAESVPPVIIIKDLAGVLFAIKKFCP